MTVAEPTIQPAHHAAGQPDGDVSGEADLRPSSDARERVHTALRLAAEQASRALRHQGQIGRQIAIELVFRDLRVVGARRTLRQPTRSSEVVFYAARDLLDKIKLSGRLVRRVRIRIARLTIASDGGQLPLPLFERETRRERLAEMVERVRDRFGETALQRANVAELTRR
jgi:DNA polymerase-4